MPYISKKEREETRWMSLTEVIERIQAVDHIEAQPALKLLILAIQEEEVHARGLSPEDLQRRVLISLEPPGWVYVDYESSRPSIEIVEGPVNDPKDLDAPDYGTVTVLRDDVNRYWPLDEAKLPRPKAPKQLAKAHIRRPPPPSLAKILEVAREVYRKNRGVNTTKAEHIIREELPGATRTLIRPILKKPEFLEQRPRPGKQPKKYLP